jgi:2-methylcitrate dehydratase PrpD
MDKDLTLTFARFASELRCDDIPDHVRERCKDLLLDALACALAGYEGEDTPKVSRFAAALGKSGESSIIGGGRLSLTGATALNGFLITSVSLCDVYRPTATHLQPVVVPPALAIAEREGASGRDLLTALTAGFEVTTRIGAGLDYPAFRSRGWHGPGVIGPFGAAAAVGRLLRFDADKMAMAFSLAGSQAAGTFAAWGTSSVKFHQFRGALSGLMAALLAEQDFVATRQFLTAPDGGFYATYSGGAPTSAATEGLRERWELEQIALRPWPTSAANQAFVSALFELIRQHDLTAANVSRMRIHLSKSSYEAYANRRTISGKWEASGSVYYTASVVLHDRDLWMDQFEPARFNDPAVRRFALEQVELVSDAGLSGVQAIVDVEMKAGATLTARCDEPKGTPENRMTRAEIEAKFRKGAQGRLGAAQVDSVVETISRLEELSSVRALMEMLRVVKS